MAVSKKVQDVTEATAAIMEVFHMSGKYHDLYDRLANRFGGFPGIWGLAAHAGVVFMDWFDAVRGKDAYIIDDLQGFAQKIQEKAIEAPSKVPDANWSPEQARWLKGLLPK